MARMRKAIQKKIDHNMQSEKHAKKSSQFSEYLNTLSLQMHPYNDSFIERLALKLVTWAKENKDAFMISQFYNNEGISERTYYGWCEKYPLLKESNETALSFIADRREMYLRDRDPGSVRYIMPQYSKIWLKEDERRNKQKQDQNSAIGNAVIEYDAILKNKKKND